MARFLFARLAQRYESENLKINRRELLKASLAASGGLLMSSCMPAFLRRRSSKKVLVIGAGFSGLACAYELQAMGYQVQIVEGRKRSGGRVLSFHDFVPGKAVEGGAEFFGSNHPAWLGYAKKFECELFEASEEENLEMPVILEGRRLSNAEVKTLFEEMESVLKQLSAAATNIPENQPWTAQDAATLDRRSTQDWLDTLNASPLCKAAIALDLKANNGAELSDQSFLGNLTQIKGGGLENYWTESEIFRARQGNQSLASKFEEALGKDRILFGFSVSQIECDDKRTVVSSTDGRKIETDEIVLTIPPSVWPKIQFTPALPAELKIQMGSSIKFLVALNKRFWKAQNLSPDSLSDQGIDMTWESTDKQAGEDGAALCAFSSAKTANAWRAKESSQRYSDYRKDLESLYPGFNAEFRNARFLDWPSDPFTGAGYSFPAPGQITAIGNRLEKGLPRLHFAGEHSCYKFVGYMEGALESGIAAAKRIAAKDGVLS